MHALYRQTIHLHRACANHCVFFTSLPPLTIFRQKCWAMSRWPQPLFLIMSSGRAFSLYTVGSPGLKSVMKFIRNGSLRFFARKLMVKVTMRKPTLRSKQMFAITCCQETRKHPALSILHRLFCFHVLFQDGCTSAPRRRSLPVGIVTWPVANQHTIVVDRIHLRA